MMLAILISSTLVVPPAILSRIEQRDGKTYEVFLAPACKSGKTVCKPWERKWSKRTKVIATDIVTPDGLIMRVRD